MIRKLNWGSGGHICPYSNGILARFAISIEFARVFRESKSWKGRRKDACYMQMRLEHFRWKNFLLRMSLEHSTVDLVIITSAYDPLERFDFKANLV